MYGCLCLAAHTTLSGLPVPGKPDVRPGLLHRHHPRVHHPVLVVLPFVTEGARLGPALDNQVVGFLEPLPVLRGSNTALEGFHRGAADEAGDDPAAGVAVQHGDLFSHADGVVDGDNVAQDGNLGALGQLGDNGGVQVDRRLHAPVGSVVLVGHNAVEPHFVCQSVLLVVLVVQYTCLLGIEVSVGESETPRLELFQVCAGDMAVGLLGEPVDFRFVLGPGQLLYHRPLLLTVMPVQSEKAHGRRRENTPDPCAKPTPDFGVPPQLRPWITFNRIIGYTPFRFNTGFCSGITSYGPKREYPGLVGPRQFSAGDS